jgi:peroxiredoxin
VSAGSGHRFPELELPDLEGRLWSTADLLGEPTVIFCFASW